MSYENILFDIREGVARITLNRPKAANAIDLLTAQELMSAAIRCDEDPQVRTVVIRAEGKMFCAGGDLASFAGAESVPAYIKEITTHLHAAISRFARMRAPVIAAVQGTAAGAGMSLVASTDLAIAVESAKFTMAYTRVALAPDGSSTYYLPRLIGHRRTLELMLTNRTLSAAEAADWGIVNQVVPEADLVSTVDALAASLAQGPTQAYGFVKKLVLHSGNESLETQMELETRAISDASRTADAREGMEAFFAKRAPKYQGN